ncbi:hypothetical protein Bca4012_035693 [Brassica carinata]
MVRGEVRQTGTSGLTASLSLAGGKGMTVAEPHRCCTTLVMILMDMDPIIIIWSPQIELVKRKGCAYSLLEFLVSNLCGLSFFSSFGRLVRLRLKRVARTTITLRFFWSSALVGVKFRDHDPGVKETCRIKALSVLSQGIQAIHSDI